MHNEETCANNVLDGPLVLRDISFEIKSGERVGIGEHLKAFRV